MEKNNYEKLTIDNWKSKIPEGWVWRRLENCVDILDYLRVPVNSEEREKRKGNIPYYGATGQIGWIDDYLFDEELVLLGEDGAPFFDKFKKVAYMISGKSWVNNHAHVLRALSSLTFNYFICHYLNQFDFHSYVVGTTRLKLNQSAMRKIPIPLPPLPEQRLIVYRVEKLLERVRRAKENLDKVPQIIKRFRQAVLKKAFSGELTVEWREKNPNLEPAGELAKLTNAKPELLKRIQEERKSNVPIFGTLPSDLPELPEGWVWCRLGKVVEPSNERVNPNELSNEPYIGLEHIESNTARIIAVGRSSDVRSTKSRFRKGDVLYGKLRPYLNKACIPDFDGICSTDILVFPCVSGIENTYLLRFLTTYQFVQYANQNMSGIQHPRVSFDKLAVFPIPLPPLSEQKEIVRRLETLFKFADEVEKKVEKAREQVEKITQSVLSKAFGGELTADFREAVKNWKNLELEERRKYIFTLPEEERKKALYGDKFPLEPGVLLKHIQEKNRKPELVRDGAGTDARPYNLNKLRHPEAKQLTLWDEQS